MDTSTALPPNHHADHPGFAGPGGVAMGLLFAAGGGATARVALEAAAVAAGDRVVDIGCGPGTAARRAARHGAEVMGVDPAPVMVGLARVLGAGGRVRWAEGAAESVPVPDGWATVVWSLSCVHHWRDLDAGLAEALRVLAPGGRLLALERRVVAGATGTASHGWTEVQAAAFAARAEAAGFVEAAVDERPSGRGPLLLVRAARP